MGLDMYLERGRLHGHTPQEMYLVADYLSWKNKGGEHSFEEWSGRKELPSEELLKDLESEVHEVGEYCRWLSGFDKVGYWRKANQIHNWFVNNVQGGEDDCGTYIVSKEQLEELLDICKTIIDNVVLVKGKVENGQKLENGELVPILEDGETLDEVSQTLCDRLLPTTSGFFFGGTDYDEYYMEDIKNTIEILTEVLNSTDFETETICYSSSW